MTEHNNYPAPEALTSPHVRIEQNKTWTESEFILPPPSELIMHNSEAMKREGVYHEVLFSKLHVRVEDTIIMPQQAEHVALINVLLQHQGLVGFKLLSQQCNLSSNRFTAIKKSINDTFSLRLKTLPHGLISHTRHGNQVMVHFMPNLVIVPDDEAIKHYYIPAGSTLRLPQPAGRKSYGRVALSGLRSDETIKEIADQIEKDKLTAFNHLSPAEYSRAISKGWLSTHSKPLNKNKT